ncbi:MAG: ABC transporter substrate-binding protein [Rhodospirillales bacterium]|nr:ABC transporter substrate-binding protein [Alphaproteobacteria bacterium]MCB9977239.1 ABC transporter substrate-binding protein [Rhodospirillales bacterium]
MLKNKWPLVAVISLSLLSGTSALALSENMKLGADGRSVAPSLLVAAKSADAEDKLSQGSKTLIEDIASRGIGFLADKSLTQDKREAEFRKLLNDNFDMDTIGRFALGRFWRTTSDVQKKEYLKLFNEMIVRVYTARFREYNGQTLEVKATRKDGEGSDAIVSSLLVPNKGEQAVAIDWRVRLKNGKFKVVDIIVEGVSMALTQRSDFASVIQRGGGDVDVLLETLRSSNK